MWFDLSQTPISNYVAEMVFFLFKTGDSMLDPSVRLYIYQSVCLQEFPNDTTCYQLSDQPYKETYIQGIAANYIMYYKMLLNLPVILLGLFCGAWSDRIGRKLPVMLPCVGTVFAVLLIMLGILNHVPSLPLVLCGAALRGAFGKSAVVTMAVHSYVSDLTSKEQRTQRLGILLAMNFFGFFAGSLLAGAMLDVTTFDVIFCTVVFINALCLLIALLFMKESLPDPPGKEPEIEPPKAKVVRSPFHVDHIRESLDVLIRRRKNRTRCHLWILFLTIIIQQTCKSGEVDITLLFVERQPLSWPKSLYGYLLATDYACLGLNVLVVLPILSSWLKFHDLTLVMIGLAFKALRLIILGFSVNTTMVYLSVVLGSPSAMIISGIKSLISKSVGEDEIGKAFSLLSCGETLSNLVGTIIFTNVYTATMELFSGFTFAVDAAFFILWIVVVFFLAQDIKYTNQYKLLQEELDPGKNYGTASSDPPTPAINLMHPLASVLHKGIKAGEGKMDSTSFQHSDPCQNINANTGSFISDDNELVCDTSLTTDYEGIKCNSSDARPTPNGACLSQAAGHTDAADSQANADDISGAPSATPKSQTGKPGTVK